MSARQFVPATKSLSTLREAAQGCRGCPLWRNATQAVFGEGPKKARVLVVGEQPGDQEDKVGHPFVGPAGQLLDRAFQAAGVNRDELYVTNAVKHFKWTPAGKRRLHAKPSPREVAACRPWLEAEVAAIKPDLIVCLGATAALTVCGPEVRVTRQRGEKVDTTFGIPALLTVHPSSLLRAGPGVDREAEFARFVEDLKKAT
jgi:uracil-DNA glycosylase